MTVTIILAVTKEEWRKIKEGKKKLLLQHKSPKEHSFTILFSVENLVVGCAEAAKAGYLYKMGVKHINCFRVEGMTTEELYKGIGEVKRRDYVFDKMKGKDIQILALSNVCEYEEKLELSRYGIKKKPTNWQYVKEQ